MTWKHLRERCYAPYSERKDVCMIVGEHGTLYPGVRIENIAFPLTMDAVQAAIFSCLSEKDKPVELLIPRGEKQDAEDLAGSRDADNLINIDSNITEWSKRFGLKTEVMPDLEQADQTRLFKSKERAPALQRLHELSEQCITPNSAFPVAAMIRTDLGTFTGVNIEMFDWQKGLCAERVAFCKARSCGASEFYDIHIYAPKSDYASPCGACRQVLFEHMQQGTITLYHNEYELSNFYVPDLLPYQFKAGTLTSHRQT